MRPAWSKNRRSSDGRVCRELHSPKSKRVCREVYYSKSKPLCPPGLSEHQEGSTATFKLKTGKDHLNFWVLDLLVKTTSPIRGGA